MKEIKEMSEEKRAQFAQKFMANAQRGQAVQRNNNVMMANYMPYAQSYAPRHTPSYQLMPQMGFSPFAPGFNPAAFANMSMGFGPMGFQQPRPMAPQMYPPQVVTANQARPMGYPPMSQPMMSQPMVSQPRVMPQPVYPNMQVPMANVQRNQYGQPVANVPINPGALLNLANGVNANHSGLAMNVMNVGNVNRTNNRGW